MLKVAKLLEVENRFAYCPSLKDKAEVTSPISAWMLIYTIAYIQISGDKGRWHILVFKYKWLLLPIY